MTQVVLTSGSSWTVPADCVLIDSVECWGAGANGSAGLAGQAPGQNPGGTGGTGGAYSRKNNVSTTPGSSIPYSIGVAGGNTSFNGMTCVALGGNAGGGAAGSTGDTKISGIAGSPGTNSGSNVGSGGAGGAGGNGGAGGPGGPAPSNIINVAGNAGGAGTFPGGGGGGGSNGVQTSGAAGPGGAGAQGRIIITYTPVVNPTVTSCAPNNATVLGGTPVTLTGTNFTNATSVTFGGVAATGVTIVNATTITCTTPAHAAGLVAVTVTIPSGSGSGNVFTYQPVTVLAADAGYYTLTGKAAAFADFVAAAAGAYSLTGFPITLFGTLSAGAYALTGRAAGFSSVEAAAPGSYSLSGVAEATSLVMEAAGAAYVFAPTDTPLVRSGFDYEFQQGGIGHYRLELERAKQLAAITRKVPGVPIDRRTVPRFEPLRTSLITTPAPAVDVQAIENKQMAAAAAEAAKTRRRRDEEALLLLAC